MAANMWKNSLKNAESDNNKILYETLLDFFLQRNGTYFLNKPRTTYSQWIWFLHLLDQVCHECTAVLTSQTGPGKITNH